MGLDRPLWAELAGAIGTKTRSQTGRPMGEPRVGKEGAGIPEDVATKPQGRWGE